MLEIEPRNWSKTGFHPMVKSFARFDYCDCVKLIFIVAQRAYLEGINFYQQLEMSFNYLMIIPLCDCGEAANRNELE